MNELTNIERLLEKFGSEEAPGDSKHRHQLRRALLRSQVFEINRLSVERWERVWSLTGAVVAGGAVAVVMVVSVRAVIGPTNVSVVTAEEFVQIAEADERPSSINFSEFMTHANAVLASVH